MQVSTKLNRSHLVHGRQALILPCLGRTEKDIQRGGQQGTSVEDAMSMVHLSHGMKAPASPHLLSEPAIIAGMAQASLPDTTTPWQDYVDDYDRIRDTMAKVLDGFEDFNAPRPAAARLPDRAAGARARLPHAVGPRRVLVAPLPDVVPADGRLILGTMRSHDQWNTTIYSNNDRYRGVKNLRTLVFMNRDDMARRGLAEFDLVDITRSRRTAAAAGLRLPRPRLRHPARQRLRLHARAERPLPARRLQRAERPAADEAPRVEIAASALAEP